MTTFPVLPPQKILYIASLLNKYFHLIQKIILTEVDVTKKNNIKFYEKEPMSAGICISPAPIASVLANGR